jgi:hypothetical protein
MKKPKSPSRVIATVGECACHSVHTTQVHHRDFPEIWAEGSTVLEGATQLHRHLGRALDSARSQWHRTAIELALVDVQQFIDSLDRAPEETTVLMAC